MVAVRTVRWNCLSSLRALARSLASRFDNGSSSRNTVSSRTSARESATRWRSAPERSRGRRCARTAVREMTAAEKARPTLDLAFDSVRRRPLRPQREGDVFPDGEVRIEPVALEDHGDAAPGRRQLVDELPINAHLAGGWLLQAGNDAQERGLSASRRSKQHHELTVARLQADAVDGIHAPERLPDLVDSDRGPLDSVAVQGVAVNVAIVLKYSGAAQRACSLPDATRACPGCAVWYAAECGRAGGCAERQHEPPARAAHFRYIGSIFLWGRARASS